MPERAIVAWLESSPAEPWWVEERLAPQPSVAGDRDVGPRSIVRAAPEREVIWLPPENDRLTGACRHASGEWSAVGVDEDRRVFLARGDASGPLERVLLDDPELASDPRAWVTTPREVPRVAGLTESSPAIGAVGEDVVISLMTEDHAVLVYRWRWEEGAFARGPRTLVSPAMNVTPYLPIGGSYDDFDAVAAPYLPRLSPSIATAARSSRSSPTARACCTTTRRWGPRWTSCAIGSTRGEHPTCWSRASTRTGRSARAPSRERRTTRTSSSGSSRATAAWPCSVAGAASSAATTRSCTSSSTRSRRTGRRSARRRSTARTPASRRAPRTTATTSGSVGRRTGSRTRAGAACTTPAPPSSCGCGRARRARALAPSSGSAWCRPRAATPSCGRCASTARRSSWRTRERPAHAHGRPRSVARATSRVGGARPVPR
ncbi:MAG: hypothetical protein M5U28_05660 [Sandaracinaceae bacterium]|nr:hypothetical protein [Sandaracinaceae bacterium]